MKMKTLTIKAGENVDEFFRRGCELAKLCDQKAPLPEWYVISFGDPSDLLNLLSDDRLELFRAVKNKPSPISALSQRLRRDRSAIEYDVDALQKAGLLKIETLTGNVEVTAPRIRLEAEFA
jgi:predicted transcriptional regulator